MKSFGIAVHGGAGTITKDEMTVEKQSIYLGGLKAAIEAGYRILESSGSSLDAVEAAVISLENFPYFNAGRGSVFNHSGKHEMDAAVMTGHDLKAGAAAGVANIKNPVSLAREILLHSGHVFLCGPGAEEFARERHLSFADEHYFFNQQRFEQWKDARANNMIRLDHGSERKFGTVGAVALDASGNIAAATSTGGITNKRYGRIGDSPLIGAGTYANNKTCAVSCTGHGEFFIRAVAAYDVAALMEYKKISLKEACHHVVHNKLMDLGGEGGLIAIDHHGNIEMVFNSEGMYRGCRSSGSSATAAIFRDA